MGGRKEEEERGGRRRQEGKEDRGGQEEAAGGPIQKSPLYLILSHHSNVGYGLVLPNPFLKQMHSVALTQTLGVGGGGVGRGGGRRGGEKRRRAGREWYVDTHYFFPWGEGKYIVLLRTHAGGWWEGS